LVAGEAGAIAARAEARTVPLITRSGLMPFMCVVVCSTLWAREDTGADRELRGNRRGLHRSALLVCRSPAARARRSPRGQTRPGRIRGVAQQHPEAGRHTCADNVRALANRRELCPPGFVVQAVTERVVTGAWSSRRR
jgi:hypothetical protein